MYVLIITIVNRQFQRDKLNDIISEMENIRYPESDVEAIDAALAEHEDRKAALQIQKDILKQFKSGIIGSSDEKDGLKNGKASSNGNSSSESSSDEEETDINVILDLNIILCTFNSVTRLRS